MRIDPVTSFLTAEIGGSQDFTAPDDFTGDGVVRSSDNIAVAVGG